MIQLQFLNHLLDTQDYSVVLNNNITEDFFKEYQNEFKFIKEHYENYGSVPDKSTFSWKFPDFDIITVSEGDRYLVDKLYEDKNRRFLADTFNKIREKLNEGNTEDAMRIYSTSMDKAVQSKKLDCIDIFKDTSRYDAYVERCDEFAKYYVKTGFPELDEIIGGWDRQEELATIAARTNQGKSWILLKCAVEAAKQGLVVGVYSGEMSDRKVGYRVDTLLGGIPNSGLTHGRVEIQNQYKSYLDNLPDMCRGTIKVMTPSMIGGPAGVTALRAFIEKEHLDMLCIDQHSLLEDDRHAKNPVEKASNISKDLKNLQVMTKIPIVSVSQQNRTSTENGVNTEHIAQSDRIAQDSTIILFFEQKDGILTLNLVKSRDSANMKKLNYSVDFDRGTFEYLEEDEVPQKSDNKSEYDGESPF